MMNQPLVSVVMPSYNQVDYLEQAICSVLDQDYPNLELMVVDGGSTDGSAALIEKYAPWLAWWVSERDHGQAEAINKGLARASGEVVAWLNSDDLYLPGAVAAAVAALQADPSLGMVYGDVQSINASGEVTNVMRYDQWGLDELMSFHIIGQPGVFMRRSVQQQAGYLDEHFHMLLDHQLWIRMAGLAPLRYVHQEWAAARYHATAKNVAQAPAFGQEAYKLLGWMQQQPGLAGAYRRNARRIRAGAYRMNGFYLLEGGQPRASLWAYLRGLWNSPALIWPEKHRVAYAAASMFIDLSRVRSWYLARRKRRIQQEVKS